MRFRFGIAVLLVVLASGCIKEKPEGYTCPNGIVVSSPLECPKPSPEKPVKPTLSFTPAEASCGGGRNEVGVTPAGDVIVVSGSLSAPTPCYTLDAELASDESEFVLRLSKKPVGGGVCIQCVGSIPFKAAVSDLTKRYYKIVVDYEGEIVFSETVDLTAPAQDSCGDGVCDSETGEYGWTCPQDCCPGVCGDGVCNTKTRTCVNYDETPQNCPQDCRTETIKIKPNIPKQPEVM